MKTKRNEYTPLRDPRVAELLTRGIDPHEIKLIDCPFCHCTSFYDDGFTCGCACCHKDIGSYSEDSYSLDEYLYEMDYENYHLGEQDALS